MAKWPIEKITAAVLGGSDTSIPAVLAECVPHPLPHSAKRREKESRGVLRRARASLVSGETARARVELLAALHVHPSSWRKAERLGLFCDPALRMRGPERLVNLLATETAGLEALCPGATSRLQSFVAATNLVRALRPRFDHYLRSLFGRHPATVKAFMALAEVLFLLRRPGARVPDDVVARLPRTTVLVRSPERFAEVVSQFIADAHRARPLRQEEAIAAPSDALASRSLSAFLDVAALRWCVRDIIKKVNILEYALVHTEVDGKAVFTCEPHEWEAERALCGAHTTTTMSAHAVGTAIRANIYRMHPDGGFAPTLGDYARILISEHGSKVFALHQSPFRRYRLQFPAMDGIKDLIRTDSLYVDEEVNRAVDVKDLAVDRTQLNDTEVAAGLTVAAVRKAHRSMRWLAELGVAGVSRLPQGDPDAFFNTLVRVSTEQQLTDIIALSGLTPAQIREYIRAFAWPEQYQAPGDAAHLDLQYTPLVRVNGSFMVAPTVLADSGPLRNLFTSRNVRIKPAGLAFEEVVAAAFRATFPRVAVNRTVSDGTAGSEQGEVDVAVLIEGLLYLMECKHSVPPETAHEHGDVWEDIKKGASQLRRAVRLLSADPNLVNRLRTWFPGASKAECTVTAFRTVIVTSTRAWTGFSYQGVPVRDVHSLTAWLEAGQGTLTERAEDHVVHHIYRYRDHGPCTRAALDDYFDDNGLHFRIRFAGWQREVVRLWESDNLALREETAVASVLRRDEVADAWTREGATFVRTETFPLAQVGVPASAVTGSNKRRRKRRRRARRRKK